MSAGGRIVCLLVAAACVGPPGALGAKGDRDQPPDELWRQYPLQQIPTEPGATTVRPQPRPSPRPTSSPPTTARDGTDGESRVQVSQLLILIGAAAAFAVLSSLVAQTRPAWSSSLIAFPAPLARWRARRDERERARSVLAAQAVRRVDAWVAQGQPGERDPGDGAAAAAAAPEVVALRLGRHKQKKAVRSERRRRSPQPSRSDADGASVKPIEHPKDEPEQSSAVAAHAPSTRVERELARAPLAEEPSEKDAAREASTTDLVAPQPAEGKRPAPAPAEPQPHAPTPAAVPAPSDEGSIRSALDATIRGALDAHEQASREIPQRAPSSIVERCSIAVWRGYVKTQFFATRGRGDVIALSPMFRAPGAGVPGRTAKSEQALAELLKRLEQDEWSVVADGPNWFDRLLERPVREHDWCE
jgi:hypothetical protein